MWIRTQNKKRLIKCDNIIVGKGMGTLLGKYTIENNVVLGIYSTEEKALKVLDMIQSFILGRIGKINNYITRQDVSLLQELTNMDMYSAKNYLMTLQHKVFQMPQDDEVL